MTQDYSLRPTPWRLNLPAEWPDPPLLMSISTLGEIESCPLRWSLSGASYPELWSGRGYPPKPHASSLAGDTVHLALEMITKELVTRGCSSLTDSQAVQVLRDLGGYSEIVRAAFVRVRDRFAKNPRAQCLMTGGDWDLSARSPDLRLRVQAMLSRTTLMECGTTGAHHALGSARLPLGLGTYAEVEFRAPQLGWKGRADLLCLSSNRCEIVDYKTGKEDEEKHRQQLWTYALIWSEDLELNPLQRPADALTLVYGNRSICVPIPTPNEQEAFRRALLVRSEKARQDVAQKPPRATPGEDTCSFCSVRQLCDSYWKPGSHRKPTALNDEPVDCFADVELEISRRHGPLSWEGRLFTVPAGTKEAGVILRVVDPMQEYEPSQKLRVLGAHISWSTDMEPGPHFVTLSRTSEVYFL